ncbi:lipopolysaccharide biosynthesis protein [uncultured Clostridium sp.]|uniref:lipopolysaccharide biosynthesis protein n=1 Tax=uncultured Clostridium sp. TaxID=59620 RepID=UPI00258340A0|nr:polysaccharide biosynthesis C-terminal domain-containing protein [uncultured Clostridium sp.]
MFNKIIKKIKDLNLNDNNKLIIYNTAGAFLVKGGALIISLITMPAYIRYFNNQLVLGVWFTLLSVLSWILTFDLGIGNGLRNHLVKSFVENDKEKAKRYISSAYVIIGIIVSVLLPISIFLFRYVNWNIFFNISESIISNKVLNVSVVIVFSGILIQFLLKLITSILYSMQKSALNNFLTLLSSIITLIYVLLAKGSTIYQNLISLAIVNVLAVNIPLFITTIIIFSGKLNECKPQISYYNKKYMKNIMKLGGIFFWVQIMYMVITTTNEFLITWLTSSDMVVEYQVYNKLFSLIGTLFTLALTPIWSAVTKALSENNNKWIIKLYRILKLLALVALICEFAMIPFLKYIVDLWIGKYVIKVNYLYSLIFAVSGSIFIWNGVISSIANGIGKLKIQGVLLTFGAIIKIPLSIVFVNLFNSWIGVIVANIVSMSLYCVIQPIWLNKFLKEKELEEISCV